MEKINFEVEMCFPILQSRIFLGKRTIGPLQQLITWRAFQERTDLVIVKGGA